MSNVKPKPKVLFVCIGNSCRSQMAEGLARAYGDDVMEAFSAGLAPAAIIQRQTYQVLKDRRVEIPNQFPKSIYEVRGPFDVIVNISGGNLPRDYPVPASTEVIEWRVRDPIGMPQHVYEEVVEQLEGLVMRLVLRMRRNKSALGGRDGTAPRRSRLQREIGDHGKI
jgi:arsenate reductase